MKLTSFGDCFTEIASWWLPEIPALWETRAGSRQRCLQTQLSPGGTEETTASGVEIQVSKTRWDTQCLKHSPRSFLPSFFPFFLHSTNLY